MATTNYRGNVTLNAGGCKPWVAYHSNGQNLGNFIGQRDAQKAIEAAYGGRFFSWQRNDLNGTIENWDAIEYT